MLNKAEMKIVMVMVFAKTRMDLLNAYVMKVLLMTGLPTVLDALIHFFCTLMSVSGWSGNMLFCKKITNAANCHIRCLLGYFSQLNQIKK